MSIPSSWGIFAYKLVTSIETSMTSARTFVFFMKLTKSVVSLRYDFCCCAVTCFGVHCMLMSRNLLAGNHEYSLQVVQVEERVDPVSYVFFGIWDLSSRF